MKMTYDFIETIIKYVSFYITNYLTESLQQYWIRNKTYKIRHTYSPSIVERGVIQTISLHKQLLLILTQVCM